MQKETKVRQRLVDHILSHSTSQEWEVAVKEWKLYEVVKREKGEVKCPCGQPIQYVCIIVNPSTRFKTYVGNNCVENFMGIDTHEVFKVLEKLEKDFMYHIPEKVLQLFFELGYVYENELTFLDSLTEFKKPTEKQCNWKKKIVFRILNKTVINKPSN